MYDGRRPPLAERRASASALPAPLTTGVVACLILALAAGAGAAPDRAAVQRPADLGEIHFPTSGAPAAQAELERGVLLLHSFEYEDAAAAFREAERRDPGFAMAYWGEAMTWNHPLWHQQDREAARAALARLAPTAEARRAKAGTEREQGWLAAIETLYGEGDKASRDGRYAAAMERLAAGDPGDLEAASFYALALLGTCESGRDVPTYMRAAAVAEEVFARNPRHPGAAHYLIHAYDDPVHAPLGLRPARVYAGIAPAAAHALHMPSHIFLALGMWDEVAASNQASWAASEARRQRLRLSPEDRGYHALSWLHYAYLQQGRFRDARRLLATMAEDAAASGSPRTREHLALMQAAWRVETRDWRADLGPLPDLSGLDEGTAAAALFAHGLAALRAGGPRGAPAPPAAADLAAIDRLLAGAAPATGQAAPASGQEAGPAASREASHAAGHAAGDGAATAGSGGYGGGAAGAGGPPPAQRAAAILRAELAALLSLGGGEQPSAAAATLGAGGDTPRQALAALERAAADEDATSYEFGPPLVVKPAHELAGELLLDLGRPVEARRHFEQALARAPRRSLSLLGLARAASREGDAAAAARAYADLATSWRHADAALPELAEAAAAAAGAGSPTTKASARNRRHR
jgi:tetratricopeptide (TPR) repeat protein